MHLTFDHNFGKFKPVFKISLTDCCTLDVTVAGSFNSTVLLYYLANVKKFKIAAEILLIPSQLVLLETKQYLDDKYYKSIMVVIHFIYVQPVNHRMQITQERWDMIL